MCLWLAALLSAGVISIGVSCLSHCDPAPGVWTAISCLALAEASRRKNGKLTMISVIALVAATTMALPVIAFVEVVHVLGYSAAITTVSAGWADVAPRALFVLPSVIASGTVALLCFSRACRKFSD